MLINVKIDMIPTVHIIYRFALIYKPFVLFLRYQLYTKLEKQRKLMKKVKYTLKHEFFKDYFLIIVIPLYLQASMYNYFS